jgi:hypothetical protein
MEDQIIDVESSEVEEEAVLTPELSLNEDKIKTPAEMREDLKQLQHIHRKLKKLRKYVKSNLYAVKQLDS